MVFYLTLSLDDKRTVVIDNVGDGIDTLVPHLTIGIQQSFGALLRGEIISHFSHRCSKAAMTTTLGNSTFEI